MNEHLEKAKNALRDAREALHEDHADMPKVHRLLDIAQVQASVSMAESLDRIAEALNPTHEDDPPDTPCVCGHTKSSHVYNEGACRPGVVCEAACEGFQAVF